MRRFFKGRKFFVLLWLMGLFTGMVTDMMWTGGGYEVQATERVTVQKIGPEDGVEVLNVVLYDDMGRKVLVRPDGTLQISESLCVEIPLSAWEEGQEGLVEIRVIYEDGTEQRNRVHIQRKSLHNGKK